MINLQGQWRITAATLNGTPQPPETLGMTLKVENNDYEVVSVKDQKRSDFGTITYRPGGRLEIFSEGDQRVQLKAIYRLSPDALTICYDLDNKEFPNGFESEPGRNLYMVTYQKQLNFDRMKKVTLTYGLIAGGIVVLLMFLTLPLHKNGTINSENGELVGYTGMVIALSLIFFGVKSYRDNYSNGIITFWQGAKVGLMITAMAAIMYGLSWEIIYHNLGGDEYMTKFSQEYIAKLDSSGKPAAEIAEEKADWASFLDMYSNNFIVRFGVTLVEIIPVGLIITLLVAALMRRKEFLPAQTMQSSRVS